MMQPPQQDQREPVQQSAFDYTLLDEDTRRFVSQKTVETQGYLKRTAEDVVQIGRNLQAVKERLPYGQFMVWVKSELGLTRQSCQNFMRVAEHFGKNIQHFRTLPVSVLYELLNAPEDVLKQVEEQQIAPTLPAIRAAKEQARQEAAGQSTPVAEEQRPDESELFQLRRQVTHLEQERRHLLQEVADYQHKEQEDPVLPAQIEQHIQTLEQRVSELTTQRETLSRHLASVSEQARQQVLERNTLSHEQQARTRWREVTTEFVQRGGMLLSNMPSSLMLGTFESDTDKGHVYLADSRT